MAEETQSLKLLESPLQRIKVALAQMAMMRSAGRLDASTLNLYSRRLTKERLEDVLAALETIQDLPREEGETSFPSIGEILTVVGVQRVARHNREQLAVKTELARWKCPECGIYQSGFIAPTDYEPRVCRGIPREGKGSVCGAVMVQVHREAA